MNHQLDEAIRSALLIIAPNDATARRALKHAMETDELLDAAAVEAFYEKMGDTENTHNLRIGIWVLREGKG